MPSLEGKYKDFQALDTEIIGISVDSVPCHENWAKSLGGITYPLAADMHRTACQAFGVHNAEHNIARRSVFLIDTKGVVRYKEISGKGELPDPNRLLAEVRKL